MISYTQRNANAEVLAESLYATLRERGRTVWLDIKMDQLNEAAMKEAAQNSRCILAIISGAERAGDSDENAYFKRPYCCNELRWAREAGAPIQPVILADDKKRIGEFIGQAPEDLKDLGGVDFIHLDRSRPAYWQVGVDEVMKGADALASHGMRQRSGAQPEPEPQQPEPEPEPGPEPEPQRQEASEPEPEPEPAVGLLVTAARKGNDRAVAELLRRGADPNAAKEQSTTALVAAAAAGHAGICSQLLAAGADHAARPMYGQFAGETALELALVGWGKGAAMSVLQAWEDAHPAEPEPEPVTVEPEPVDEASLQRLLEMGFERSVCEAALAQAGGDMRAAAVVLLEGGLGQVPRGEAPHPRAELHPAPAASPRSEWAGLDMATMAQMSRYKAFSKLAKKLPEAKIREAMLKPVPTRPPFTEEEMAHFFSEHSKAESAGGR